MYITLHPKLPGLWGVEVGDAAVLKHEDAVGALLLPGLAAAGTRVDALRSHFCRAHRVSGSV